MKKIYPLLAVPFLTTVLFGQSKLLPNNSSKTAPKTINKKYASNHLKSAKANYLLEDFDSGTFPPSNWTVQSGSSSTITNPATQAWHEENNGNPNNCASVLYDNSVDTHDEWLITPTINLSASSSNVRLEFEFNTSQFWHVTPNDNADIEVVASTDGGNTWSSALFVEDDLSLLQAAGLTLDWEQYVWTTARVDISAYSGMSNVQFAWHYAGTDGAQYNLDNVSIYDVEANDLLVEHLFITDPSTDFEYTMLPFSQARPFAMGIAMFNVGHTDQTNSTFTYEINDGSSTVDAGTANTSITSMTFNRDTIYHTTSYSTASIGTYAISTTLQSDNTDATPLNNTISRTMEITHQTWACDEGNFDSYISNVADGEGDLFKIGNQFIAVQQEQISAVEVGIANFQENINQLVFAEVYLFDGSNFIYIDQTHEYTITSSDLGVIVRLPLYQQITLSPNDHLLVVAAHYGGASDGSDDVRIATSGKSIEGSVLGFDNTNSLFQLVNPSTPIVRLYIPHESVEELLSNVTVNQNHPNPLDNNTTINYSLLKSSSVEFSISEISGKQVYSENLGVLNQGEHTLEFNGTNLSSGTYFYTFKTETGSITKKMTITH